MNSEKGFGVFEANHTMLYFQYFSAEQNQVIDEAIICALPGCKTPPHMMQQAKPETVTETMPLPALKAPPVPAAPPSSVEPNAPGTLDSFYPDDVREEDMYDETGSPLASYAPESQMPTDVPIEQATEVPQSDDVEQAIPSATLPLSPEDEGQGASTAEQAQEGTEVDAVDKGVEEPKKPALLPEELPEFVQQPGAFQYIPISQVEDNLPNGGLFAPNMKGFLEQESVGGKVVIEDFPSDDGEGIGEEVESAARGAVDPKQSEAGDSDEVDEVYIIAAESGGSLPVGLILAVVALCFAALLGVITLVGLLIIQRRSSREGDNPEMGHRMHAMPPQLCTNNAADLHSLEATPRWDLTPRSAASRLSWTAGKMLSSVLETPRMRSLREKHNHDPQASPGVGGSMTSGDTPGVLQLDTEAASAGSSSGRDSIKLEPSVEEESGDA